MVVLGEAVALFMLSKRVVLVEELGDGTGIAGAFRGSQDC